jgi:transcriptional regulator with XRE-family HTH domain
MPATIGARLREFREARGFSLRAAAGSLAVDAGYLSRVETGKARPSSELLERAAAEYEVPADELMLLAGRVPERWQGYISASPGQAATVLREALAGYLLDGTSASERHVLCYEGERAIEDELFPFERLSEIAEVESWRKEIYRPVYHVHKWWAQRLGSVFRAIALGVFTPKGSDVLQMFYQPARIPGAVVYDPFMGSGTTVGETLKLGGRAVGRDINPVAWYAVRNALNLPSREDLQAAFSQLRRDVAPRIRHYYQTRLSGGEQADVLYYFWVKVVPCPACDAAVDLFSSRIFAKHAYPRRHPSARAVCPGCGEVNTVRYDARKATCSDCGEPYDPQDGPARNTTAVCPRCKEQFRIGETVRTLGHPPAHRMYAKLALLPSGRKEYYPVTDFDLDLYQEAASELASRSGMYPVSPIEPGYNTNQALAYCYTQWHQMFNDRQLLCIGLLGQRICQLAEDVRHAFVCLLSGVLEFNNMFASFKGEGTGAVRHMFSHHILKPERTPLEANVWGTPKSSGAFSTLFRSRLLRAVQYRDNPFELRVRYAADGRKSGQKVYGLSHPLHHESADSWEAFGKGGDLYLSCGTSSQTDLPSGSVDAVVTDPPFFDNVHYSELADFFYVWQRHWLEGRGPHVAATTRSNHEVQDADAETFTERLSRVFDESRRILKDDGLFVFTYHHSRPEGWESLLRALVWSKLLVTAAHPITAEMSVAQPKHQAKEPIHLDVIVVCRKRERGTSSYRGPSSVMPEARAVALDQISRLNSVGVALSRNDVRVVLAAQVVRILSAAPDLETALTGLAEANGNLEAAIEELHQKQAVSQTCEPREAKQVRLFRSL